MILRSVVHLKDMSEMSDQSGSTDILKRIVCHRGQNGMKTVVAPRNTHFTPRSE